MFGKLLVAGCLLCYGTIASAACAPKPGDAEAVTAVMRDLYAAATKDDLAKFQSLLLPGFYAYDNGKRWDGDSLMQAVIKWHQQGIALVWSVTEPDVHVGCDMAWIAYVNRGSVKTPADTEPTPMSWLESATLQREGKDWKLAFFQSERVPKAPN